jgi:hypothetical protein
MKRNLISVSRFSLLLFAALITLRSASQQNIIADVDNTHPQVDRYTARTAWVANFSVHEGNNCNEITWSAIDEQETRKYIVEYSMNGIEYLTAGEVVASNKPYMIRHYFNNEQPAFYRLRTEQLNGKYFYSNPVAVTGPVGFSPLEVYPTIVTGNFFNVNASLPVEKLVIVSENGTQVYTKAMDGKKDYIPVAIPSLGSGIYFVVFYGRYWKTTRKIIIQ